MLPKKKTKITYPSSHSMFLQNPQWNQQQHLEQKLPFLITKHGPPPKMWDMLVPCKAIYQCLPNKIHLCGPCSCSGRCTSTGAAVVETISRYPGIHTKAAFKTKPWNDMNHDWLVVEPTYLKNMSQNGNLPQVGVKIKNV